MNTITIVFLCLLSLTALAGPESGSKSILLKQTINYTTLRSSEVSFRCGLPDIWDQAVDMVFKAPTVSTYSTLGSQVFFHNFENGEKCTEDVAKLNEKFFQAQGSLPVAVKVVSENFYLWGVPPNYIRPSCSYHLYEMVCIQGLGHEYCTGKSGPWIELDYNYCKELK